MGPILNTRVHHRWGASSKYQFEHLTQLNSELTQEFTSVKFEGAMDNERQETVKYRYAGG